MQDSSEDSRVALTRGQRVPPKRTLLHGKGPTGGKGQSKGVRGWSPPLVEGLFERRNIV